MPPGRVAGDDGGSPWPETPCRLIDLALRRICLGDKIAAAKFGTALPVDDPVRERQVLDQVRRLSIVAGIDPLTSTRFFRAQIEASKIVQRGLYAQWTAHPQLRPTDRPDLATEVRPLLDQITGEILDQLKTTATGGGVASDCRLQLTAASVAASRQNLDQLYRNALRVALAPICHT